jgi:hypothetical protein
MKNSVPNSVKRQSVLAGTHHVNADHNIECFSYLGAWFETLKHSPHYAQMCRSGIFNSAASFKTYEMFGAVEDLTFEQWWACKGLDEFGCGCIYLENGYEITYQSIGLNTKVSISFPLAQQVRAIGFDGLALAISNKFRGLLSDRPAIWPFFKSKVSPFAIGRSLQVVRACQRFAATGKFRMWEIGEQLNLKRASTGQPGDWRIDLTDKHIDMGKLVSAENKRGMTLAFNASQGFFPSFAKR